MLFRRNAIVIISGLLLVGGIVLAGWAWSATHPAEANSQAYLHATALSGGVEHNCALLQSGNVKCWGDNLVNELGNKTDATNGCPDEAAPPTPTPTPARTPCSKVPIYVCGAGPTPTPPPSGCTGTDKLANVTALSHGAAQQHTCAIVSPNANLYCWGSNAKGQLGGTSYETCLSQPCSTRPVKVTCQPAATGACDANGFLQNISQVAGGNDHTCAIDTSTFVWCWGGDLKGQLGDGTVVTSRTKAARVCLDPCGAGFLQSTTSITAGPLFSCAITGSPPSNTVSCWGGNGIGELGIGVTDAIAHPLPSTVCGTGQTDCANHPLTNVSAIDTGGYGSIFRGHTCVLIPTDGSMKCWGYNKYGELGNASTVDSSTPVDVCAPSTGPPCASHPLTGVAVFGALGQHTCAAMLGNGAAYCWGWNPYGEIGTGSFSQVNVLVPTAVCSYLNRCPPTFAQLTNIVAFVGGYAHSCALQSGDPLGNEGYCWGWNIAGQLGDNTTCCEFPPPISKEYSDPYPHWVNQGS